MGNQLRLFSEQNHRIYRLLDQVDYVVTDGPILLSLAYLKEGMQKFNKPTKSYWEKCFEDLCIETHFQYDNINFYIKRGDFPYESNGRRQNLEEAKVKDEQILAILEKYDISHHKVSSVDEIVDILGVK